MPTDAPVQFTPPDLTGYCFTTWKQLALDLFGRASGYLPGTFTLPVIGDNTPGPDDRDKLWIRTILGKYDDNYLYDPSVALWVAPFRPSPDSGAKVQIYTGDPANVPTLDGGTNVAVTAYQGPFWTIATEFAARFPLGLGTLPSGAVINSGTNGGEENHTLLLKEIPSHTHVIQPGRVMVPGNGGGGVAGATFKNNDVGEPIINPAGGDPTTSPANQTAPHNNMPPYVGCSFIRRTARIYKTLPP